jgi:hypothetical protein
MLWTLPIQQNAYKCSSKTLDIKGEGKKFGTEWNGKDLQLGAFSAL